MGDFAAPMKRNNLLLPCSLLVLFFALALFSQANAGSDSSAKSGMEGTILISPVMPGPTREGMSDSRPLPNTEFVVRQGDQTITSFTTDDAGNFRVSLPPGHYQVTRKEGNRGAGFFGPFDVDVAAGKMKSVQWKCDSGIR